MSATSLRSPGCRYLAVIAHGCPWYVHPFFVLGMSWDVLGYPYPQCQIASTFRTPKCKPRFRLFFFHELGGSYLVILTVTTIYYGKSTGKAFEIWRSRTVSCRFSQNKSIDGSPPLHRPLRGMHQQFERSAQHVHLAYSSFCGASPVSTLKNYNQEKPLP